MMRGAAALGGGLVLLYTGMMAGADGITKLISGQFEAPQLFALSSFLVMSLCWAAARSSPRGNRLRVGSVKTMWLRAVLTVIASVAFFEAFRRLPFADVFLFIALIPLIAAALSGPLLGEPPRPLGWVALSLGAGGGLFLVPGGPSGLQGGHGFALLAAVAGTGSLLAARVIARRERKPLAQVFWPNLALVSTMGLALPFVWKPLGWPDVFWIATYSVFLFGARYVLAEAMRLLPAHVATPLMNLQFVWMVGIGYAVFQEVPRTGTILGVMLVVASSLVLVAEESHARVKQPA